MQNLQISLNDKIGMNEPKGLTNNGNTCYFNSLLQCILNSDLYNQSYFEAEDDDDLKGQAKMKNLIFQYVMEEDEVNP